VSRPAPTVRRYAVYNRVSTDHRLEQDFNSLDAQREPAEAYVRSPSPRRTSGRQILAASDATARPMSEASPRAGHGSNAASRSNRLPTSRTPVIRPDEQRFA